MRGPEPTYAVRAVRPQGHAATAAYDDNSPSPESDGAAELPTSADDHQREAIKAAELMLAQLAAESEAPLKSFAGNFDSNGAKVALIAGGLVIVVIVLFGLMALIGTLLPAK